jgi:hypothetical protein
MPQTNPLITQVTLPTPVNCYYRWFVGGQIITCYGPAELRWGQLIWGSTRVDAIRGAGRLSFGSTPTGACGQAGWWVVVGGRVVGYFV